MGGACMPDNIIKTFIVEDNNNIKENYDQNNIQENDSNNINKKQFHILSNLLEKDQDKKPNNKRYSDFQSLGNVNGEKDLKFMNINKVSNIEGKNTSCNDTSLLNNLTNNNDENNAKLYSNFNSSNFNGAIFSPALPDKKKDLHLSPEEKNMNLEQNHLINNNINNNNNYNHDKHNNIRKKIQENEEDIKNTDTNINLGGNNVIFINISRGSAIMHTPHNNHEIENFESTTPKMIMDKKNLDEPDKGNLKMFSHFCQIKTQKNKKKDNQSTRNEFIPTFDMNKYSEEMLNVINSIRTNPKSFIQDINYIVIDNIQKTDEGVFIISNDKEEKLKLMDNYIEIIDHAKEVLNNINCSPYSLDKLEKLQYNDDLEILFDESNYEDVYPDIDIKDLPSKLNTIYDENGVDKYVDIDNDSDTVIFEYNENVNLIDFNSDIEKKEKEKENCDNKINIININNNFNINNNEESNKPFKIKYKKKKKNINCLLDLNDDRIANLILHKRKELKSKYPNIIFKISVIKDIKISILVQIAMEEYFKDSNKKTLLDLILDSKYKYFAVGWTKEINRNFLSIYCFA